MRLLAGPAAFAVVSAAPLTGLAPEAHFTLAGYAWNLAWWIIMLASWVVTSFLPFVILRLGGALDAFTIC